MPKPVPVEPPRKRWTRSECEVLEASGLLDWQHLELIEGELISKLGKQRPHVNSQMLLLESLIQVFGFRFVNGHAPIDVAPEDNPANEPEPDIIVLKRESSHFSDNPRPEDLNLVVEIADTTLQFDLTTKAALYARAGIAEYWVLDLRGPAVDRASGPRLWPIWVCRGVRRAGIRRTAGGAACGVSDR
jgi:Uma2 family endonuclease